MNIIIDTNIMISGVFFKAIYIVSGDKDLLDIKYYDGIQILTAKEFCEAYLS